jgi:hypothetical protein
MAEQHETDSRFVPRPRRRARTQQMDYQVLDDLIATAENGQAVHIPIPAGKTVFTIQNRYRIATTRRGYAFHYRVAEDRSAILGWTARYDSNEPVPDRRYGR